MRRNKPRASLRLCAHGLSAEGSPRRNELRGVSLLSRTRDAVRVAAALAALRGAGRRAGRPPPRRQTGMTRMPCLGVGRQVLLPSGPTKRPGLCGRVSAQVQPKLRRMALESSWAQRYSDYTGQSSSSAAACELKCNMVEYEVVSSQTNSFSPHDGRTNTILSMKLPVQIIGIFNVGPTGI